jgi:hypothetical protein
MRGGRNTMTRENVRAAWGKICHKNFSGSLISLSLDSGGCLRLASKLTKMGPSNATSFVGQIDQREIFHHKSTKGLKTRKTIEKNIACFLILVISWFCESRIKKRPKLQLESGLLFFRARAIAKRYIILIPSAPDW